MKNKIKQIICEDIKGKKYQVDINELTFRPAVYGVIVQEGKILMSKQWEGYDFPGGGIDLGEDTQESLIREVKEETGIDVTVGEILHGENSFFKLPFRDNFVHSIHMYYECLVIGGEISTELFDEHEKKYAQEAEWLNLEDITKVKIYSSADINKVLKKYL